MNPSIYLLCMIVQRDYRTNISSSLHTCPISLAAKISIQSGSPSYVNNQYTKLLCNFIKTIQLAYTPPMNIIHQLCRLYQWNFHSMMIKPILDKRSLQLYKNQPCQFIYMFACHKTIFVIGVAIEHKQCTLLTIDNPNEMINSIGKQYGLVQKSRTINL